MARRHTIAQKTPARSAATVDDVFLEKTIAASSWAQRNRNFLGIGAVALAVLIGAGVYYLSYRRGHSERAAVELERVRTAVAFGDTATAKVELGNYIETFGGTPHANEARLLLGQLYLQGNQADQGERTGFQSSITSRTARSDPRGTSDQRRSHYRS